MINRARLRRWHVWLGWVIAIPMLLWTLSGLVMVVKPIEEVRGEYLLADPQPMRFTGALVTPALAGVHSSRFRSCSGPPGRAGS